MKLLVADKLEAEALRGLAEIRSLEVVSNPSVTKDELPAALSDVDILIVRSKEVRRPAIEAARSLALVIRAGAGTNTIDVDACSERGVYVANCPGKNAIAVAELAIGMMLALDRRLPEATASLREGKWEKGEFGKGEGMFGKRLGIVGFGAIGREVTLRAHALGMHVGVFTDILSLDEERETGITRVDTLERLASQSDVLSVHLPLTKATRGLVGKTVFDALPRGAVVINTARSEVMDYDALEAAVASKGLRVGLDVFPGEPEGAKGVFTHPLLSRPSVVATPHIGASTQQAQSAIAAETVRIVRSFVELGEVPNCVNIASHSPARCQLVVRHYDRVGVLANILAVIKQHAINVEEMTNTPFAGHKAACAKLRLAEVPTVACLKEIEASSPDVLHVETIAIG